MPKMIYVKSARAAKMPRHCYRCGYEIQPGDSYQHTTFKTGPYSSMDRNWCRNHPPRSSETTVNDRLSRLYSAQESVEDAMVRTKTLADLEDLATALDDAAEEAELVRDEYQESHDNMPENLQYSAQSEELENKANACDTWADELRSAADEVRGHQSAGEQVCAECDQPADAAVHDDKHADYDHDYEEPDESAELADALGEAESANSALDL